MLGHHAFFGKPRVKWEKWEGLHRNHSACLIPATGFWKALWRHCQTLIPKKSKEQEATSNRVKAEMEVGNSWFSWPDVCMMEKWPENAFKGDWPESLPPQRIPTVVHSCASRVRNTLIPSPMPDLLHCRLERKSQIYDWEAGVEGRRRREKKGVSGGEERGGWPYRLYQCGLLILTLTEGRVNSQWNLVFWLQL